MINEMKKKKFGYLGCAETVCQTLAKERWMAKLQTILAVERGCTTNVGFSGRKGSWVELRGLQSSSPVVCLRPLSKHSSHASLIEQPINSKIKVNEYKVILTEATLSQHFHLLCAGET